MSLNAITRKSAFAALLLLVVILVVTALRSHFSPFEVELCDSPYGESPLLLVVAMFIYLCTGIVVGKMFPRSGLNKGFCMLPVPIYGVLACGIVVAPSTLLTAAASFCFALALFLLLRSLHVAEEKNSIFFASILLGAMVLFVPSTILLVAVLPLSFFLLALSLRQLLLMVWGYILPLFAASYVMWYRGDSILDFGRNLLAYLVVPQVDEISGMPYVAIAMLIFVAILLLWGVIYHIVRPDKMFMLVRVRHAFYLFLGILLLALSILFIPACNLSLLSIVAIPLAILLSLVLNILPNNHSTVAYWVLLLLFSIHLFLA